MPTTAATATKLSFLAQLGLDLAAISTDNFFNPPAQLPEGAVQVGLVNDDARRLFTLLASKHEAYNLMVRRRAELEMQISEAMDSPDHLSSLLSLVNGSLSKEVIEELQQLEQDLPIASRGIKLVTDLYWTEVRNQYPELNGKTHIGVYAGWIACWEERPKSLMETILSGGDLPQEVLDGLGEILGGVIKTRRAA